MRDKMKSSRQLLSNRENFGKWAWLSTNYFQIQYTNGFFCSFISGLCRWASVGISCTNLGWNPIWHFVHAPYAVCVYVSACVGIIWSIQYAPLLHNERRIGQVWLVSSTRAHLYPAHTSSSLILQNNVPLYSTEYESFITLRIYTYAALHTWKYTIFNSNYFEFRRRNYY